jgi:tRNA threonylcarbamoyladenosine biosynthesis protein TsaB
VAQALERTGSSVVDLQALGVASGPGSFTSLRVGMAFVKGLALAHRLPLVAVPTLDVIAHAQPLQPFPLVAVLEAGRGRLAAGRYRAGDDGWQPVGEPELTTARALLASITRPTVICGELTAEVRRVLGRKYRSSRLASPARATRRPSFLAEMAWDRWQAGHSDDPASLTPTYLHPDARPVS